ncbi:MAG: AAA family ATPase [Peptostreptococcaceae bacterium]|nr:AAA family ATPase [Peptostreptococcaceae bacterium]
MLQKISKIQNLGKFESFSGGVELSKSNIIFGFNGTGKSTISDMFYSLSNQEKALDILEERKTLLREDEDEKEVIIELQDDNGTLKFEKGKWNKSINIFTFNERYIEDYVLVSEEFKGDIALVAMGSEGAKILKRKNELEKNINDLYIPKIKEVLIEHSAWFSSIPKIGLVKSLIRKSGKKIEEVSNISLYSPEEQKKIEIEIGKDSKFASVRDFLGTCIEAFKTIPYRDGGHLINAKIIEDILLQTPRVYSKLIANHMSKYINDNQISWLLSGYNNQKDEDFCPYCGQKIVGPEAIRFFKEMKNFTQIQNLKKEKEIRDNLRGIIQKMDADNMIASVSLYNDIIGKLFEKKILTKSETDNLVIGDDLDIIITGYNQVIKKMWEKTDHPFEKISISEECLIAIKMANKIIKKISVLGNTLQTNIDKIEKKIEKDQEKEYKKALLELSRSVKRSEIELAIQYAKSFTTAEKEINQIKLKFDDLYDKIKLTRINEILKELNVKFRLTVKNRNFYVQLKDYMPKEYKKRDGNQTLFSEGEKRALAFAYFISEIPSTNLEKKTIVIDDPVSSMDLSRRAVMAYQISRLIKDDSNQIIILSHDITFVERICYFTEDDKITINKLEMTNQISSFMELNINDYLSTDEMVYESFIETAIKSCDPNDIILGLMSLRPYAYIKKCDSKKYKEIERRATYFAHTVYSYNKARSIYFRSKWHNTGGLRAYVAKINKAIKIKKIPENEMISDNFTFNGFDYESVTNLYKAIPLDSITNARKKALVLRPVLEACLFQLVSKQRFNPEHIGTEYTRAINGTRNEIKEKCKKLKELFDITKKYHHGAEDGSTLGLSWVNPDELEFLNEEILEIVSYIDTIKTNQLNAGN